MVERPGPQPENAGITPGHKKPKSIAERLDSLEAMYDGVADAVLMQADRLDKLEKENRRLRAELGANAK